MKKKLFIIDGAERIGKSSFLIPAIQNLIREKNPFLKVNTLNDNEWKIYMDLTKHIEKNGIENCENSRIYWEIFEMYSAPYLYLLSGDVVILNRGILSNLIYSKVFERFKIVDNNFPFTSMDYMKTMNTYANKLLSCFDICSIVVTWKYEKDVIPDDFLTFDQTKLCDMLFKNASFYLDGISRKGYPVNYLRKIIDDTLFLRLEKIDGKSDYSEHMIEIEKKVTKTLIS